MITPCSDIEHSTSKGCVITDGAVAACRGAGIMSFVDLLEDLSFDSETIEVITEAFETACRDLRLTDRRDPITETLALKIIEAAQTGERDPDLIRQQAMESLAGKSSA